MKYFGTVLSFLLLFGCSSEKVYKGSFSDKQICSATIAMVMAKPAKEMFAVHGEGNVMVMYQRENDEKMFSYECFVSGNKINKKIAGRDWNITSRGEKFTFEAIIGEEGGEQLSIFASYGDSSPHQKQNFNKYDFN